MDYNGHLLLLYQVMRTQNPLKTQHEIPACCCPKMCSGTSDNPKPLTWRNFSLFPLERTLQSQSTEQSTTTALFQQVLFFHISQNKFCTFISVGVFNLSLEFVIYYFFIFLFELLSKSLLLLFFSGRGFCEAWSIFFLSCPCQYYQCCLRCSTKWMPALLTAKQVHPQVLIK